MNRYSLKIAGYPINFERETGDFSFNPSTRFRSFITENQAHGISIKVYKGECPSIESAKIVFSAPYVEEINGIRINVKTEFWEILRDRDNIYIKTTFPLEEKNISAILSIPKNSNIWSMWIKGGGDRIDPLAYPMDGLLLYYLSSINGDIMIHGSGISDNGKGLIFSGESGAGKSTMARLWKEEGVGVVHDDRLIIRKGYYGYIMYNTPVYDNEKPVSAPISKIFLIGHGASNQENKIGGVEAVTSVLSNCIQHNWNKDLIDRTLGSVKSLCDSIPIARLNFLPDSSVVSFIRYNMNKTNTNNIYPDKKTEVLRDIGVEILSSGTSIQVSANGYSMYPTIKPCTKIVINKTESPIPGDIIAINKDGKLVVHRLVKIIEEKGNFQFIARGDSNRYPDPPMFIGNIVGKVADLENIPDISRLRYCINRIMARMAMLWDKLKKYLF